MQIHLDLIGGLAGDMFIAALLDAFPQHEACVLDAIHEMGDANEVDCSVHPHRDSVLRGSRFQVQPRRFGGGTPWSISDPPQVRHEHATWSSIRARLLGSSLAPGVRLHAIGIFQLLADAEASVHGVEVETVEFHEVGSWDSIADIVGAAALIDALGATLWTASPAPLGSGQVRTAHGMLPVPAPATTRLLLGMPVLDDGIGGERVTPTGAAILRYLCPPATRIERSVSSVRTLTASGIGFGMRVLPGLSNHVRVLCFSDSDHCVGGHREMHELQFEVDDQSGEDLAVGLDRLRAHEAVLDVTQSPVFGKKGRMMVHVRLLVRQTHLDEVVDACFRETTTIGVRHQTVHGIGLKRRFEEVSIDGHRLRVKVVERPGGPTAKAESDDTLMHEAHSQRAALRARAEAAVLQNQRLELDA